MEAPRLMEEAANEVRNRIQYYIDHGMNEAARHLLVYLLWNGKFPGRNSKSTIRVSMLDYYKYVLVLERLHEYSEIIRLVDSLHSPAGKIPPPLHLYIMIKIIQVRALKRTGQTSWALNTLEQLLSLLDKGVEAEESNTCADIPPNYQVLFLSKIYHAALFHLKGELLRSECKVHQAREAEEQCLISDPLYLSANADLCLPSNGPCHEAKALFESGSFHKCATLLTNKLKTSALPSPVWMNEMLAICYAEMNCVEDLEVLFNEVKRDRPEHVGTLLIHALWKQVLGQREESRRLLVQSTHADEHYKLAWLCLGHSYGAMGDHEQAVASYAYILCHIDDNCLVTLLAMAGEHLHLGKAVFASPYLHTAMTIGQSDPYVTHELAVLLYVRGEWAKAIELLNGVLDHMDGSHEHRITVKRNLLMIQLRIAVKDCNKDQARETIDLLCDRPFSCALALELQAILHPESRPLLLSRAISALSTDTVQARKYRHLLELTRTM